MKLKLKIVAVAALLAVAGVAQARIADSNDNGSSSSGDMFASFMSVSNTASFTVDLGVRLDQFAAAFPASRLGVKLVWDLDGSTFSDLSTNATGLAALVQPINYGTVFNTFATPAVKGAPDLKFDVKAMDGLPTSLAGAGLNRYLSTSPATTVTATNTNVFAMDAWDVIVTAQNADATNSTHGGATGSLTIAGANMFNSGDNVNVNANAGGDKWFANTNFNSTGPAASSLNFFALTNSSSTGAAQATVTKYAGQWSFDSAQNQLIYTSPVPEADTYAMLLAGLGLMGAIVRRRRSV